MSVPQRLRNFSFDSPIRYVTIKSHVSDRHTDRVFKALADRTRRRMLDLLADRPRTTGELAMAFPKLSRFAVMKHLRVLERAGLVIVSRDGRKRWNSLNAAPLKDVLRRWVSERQEMWADVMLNIRDAAEADEGREKSEEGEPS